MKKLFFIIGLMVALASCASSSDDTIENMTIASRQADCTGVGPMKCLLVKYEKTDVWQYFYSGIEGFDYQPGYEYRIKVRIDTVANPPADGSSLKYTFLELISKEEKESEGLPESLLNR